MPWFMEPIAETADLEDQSIIVIDKRDDRMVSPFQTWLVSEIMANAASSINVLTERDQVMPPNSGYHVALFGNYTLDGIKVVVAVQGGMRTQLVPSLTRHFSRSAGRC